MFDVEPVVVDEEALAKELGGEPTEPPKQETPSKTPPKGEETPKPPDTTEGAQPPKEEKEDGEKPADGETPPDPLEEFTQDPDKALQGLLAHPKLGPMLNRWANKTIEAQVRAAKTEPQGPTEAQLREKLKVEEEDKYFSEVTPGQLKEDLADPETGAKAAASYGRYQLRKEQQAKEDKGLSPEDLNQQVSLQAARSLVTTYRSMVDDSELSDEVKAELQPEKFTHLGAGSLEAWGKAIYEAHVAHGVALQVESAKEEALAKLDPERKGSGGGRPPGAMPDLMGTDSSVGLETALAAEEAARKK